MMASEVAPSSPSPFGCSGYQNLVDDEIDLWVHQPGWKKEEERKDKWARAREIVFPKQVEAEGEASSVSSLVQKWRGLEASNKVSSSSSSSPCPCGGAGDDAESIGDWESDRTGPSTRDSDFSESERLRVADIIRRLTEDVESSPPRVRTTDNHNQYSDPPLSPVVGSPRIRGRQAYVDLLTQMERDRRKELQRLGGRKAVSQFSHRGRIQALLRIKSLRRGLGAMEGRFSNSSIPPDLPKPKPSTLRLEATTAHPAILKQQQCVAQLHQVPTPFTNYNQGSDKLTTTTSDQDAQESNGNQQDTACWVHEQEVVISCKGDWIGEVTDWDTNNQETDQQATTASDQDAQESNGIQQDTVCWVSELHEQEIISCKGDWIGEVSRPRSDWEDLRQARYQEMLDPFLENEEIRALLGRKSVSAFLSSGLREKIDQVMMFRAQAGQAQAVVKKNADYGVVEEEEMKEKHEEEEEEEEHSEYNLEEFEEGDKSSVEQQYTAESDEYMASPAASWPQINQAGHESSAYSSFDQAACTPTPSNGQTSSYEAHPSAAIEMELIYDLRRHMEQLHQEMSELRKSIKCCTDMQVKLQRSIKKEVTTVLTNPGPVRKGRRCSVCRKVQVDCVLYRCGHMCTCFRCGHELQWSSGKCPVCKAPIVDVVRTYSNY